jgi:tripartite-type tricarboxylate transporter receptor subunit TctC
MKRLLNLSMLIGLIALTSTPFAYGAEYPIRPITLIVPYPAGGITDIVARNVGEKLSASLGQPVVIENKAGAGGTIGAESAARANPDGYTLFLGTSATNGTNPSTITNLRYKPATDFAPIALLASAPLLIVVHPAVPANTVSEFIAYAKANPNRINYATTGTGGSIHLTTEQFAIMTGLKMNHVPYKGSAPAETDLMGGHVQVMFDNVPSAAPLAQAGKVKSLAITSEKRSALVPDIPTVAESAVPGFDSSSWIALYAPAKTPSEIIKKLNTAINVVLKDPNLLTAFSKSGLDPQGGSAEVLANFQDKEIKKWAEVVQKSGYVPE